jgi:hypothetical protein
MARFLFLQALPCQTFQPHAPNTFQNKAPGHNLIRRIFLTKPKIFAAWFFDEYCGHPQLLAIKPQAAVRMVLHLLVAYPLRWAYYSGMKL